jgi:hypothetical protein
VERGAIVGDPISASGEEGRVFRCSANSKNAAASGFAGTGAGGRVFDDDAILRGKLDGGGSFEIGLRIGLAALDVGGGDEVGDVFPEVGDAQADFGEGACGGSDYGESAGRNCSEQFFGARECDDVGDILDFTAFHPLIFGKMDRGVGVGQKFPEGVKAHASVGEVDDVFGIHIVLESPAGPDASDGGGGVNQDAIHVDKQAFTTDLGHRTPDLHEVPSQTN